MKSLTSGFREPVPTHRFIIVWHLCGTRQVTPPSELKLTHFHVKVTTQTIMYGRATGSSVCWCLIPPGGDGLP